MTNYNKESSYREIKIRISSATYAFECYNSNIDIFQVLEIN